MSRISFSSSTTIVPTITRTTCTDAGIDLLFLFCPLFSGLYYLLFSRTGRAGNQGYAYTFITPEQKRYAGHIIKALEQSLATVPDELKSIWDEYVKEMEAVSC